MSRKFKAKAKKSSITFDLNLLDPVGLQSEETFDGAIGTLESHLQFLDDDNRVRLLNDLMAVDHRLEFALAVMSDDVASFLTSWILETFPTQVDLFLSSFHSNLLVRLSTFFWGISDTLLTKDIHTTIRLSQPCIRALYELLSAEEDAFSQPKSASKRKTRKDSRAPPLVINAKPFRDLEVSVPSTRKEAIALGSEILQNQSQILQELFATLRDPQHQQTFKGVYLFPVSAGAGEFSSGGGKFHRTKVQLSPQTIQNDNISGYRHSRILLEMEPMEGMGPWKVLLSNRADGDFRAAHKKDPRLFSGVVHRIRELSHGRLAEDDQFRLTSVDTRIRIYRARVSRDYWLLYHIHCTQDFESGISHQVLRILAIESQSRLNKSFWEAVAKVLSSHGTEYQRRCSLQLPRTESGRKIFLPASFTSTLDNTQTNVAREQHYALPQIHGADIPAELHSLLVLEKFHDLSQVVLDNIIADRDASYVFDMSPKEQEIVKHPTSCYVIGRSGTGKTTTMLLKILGHERGWAASSDEFNGSMNPPRQMFITQSMVLAEKVREAYIKMLVSYQSQQQASGSTPMGPVSGLGLYDADEEAYRSGKLPEKYSDLGDSHFPFFGTVDQLYRMLEADLGIKRSEPTRSPRGEDTTTYATEYMLQDRASFVSYTSFLKNYWSSISHGGEFDPSLAFAEILSVIKGSEDSLRSKTGYIERNVYTSISERAQGTFAGRRDLIYDVFERYQRKKHARGEYDAADRSHAVLKGLRHARPGVAIDYLYVDEAQDILMVDALVLRALCRNPDGLFWAGDTAQTISAGSAFRFNDLKAFMYRFEERITKEMSLTWKKQDPPQLFTLSVNYRSHLGIVNCAKTVIQLITKFWPDTIDPLPDERTYDLGGVKPTFFGGDDENGAAYDEFLFKPISGEIEFGADQCILVRDDSARREFVGTWGEIGLVLTVPESKGLEFNDVLLYNFFGNSTATPSQWRILTRPPDRLDLKLYSIICRELKTLYVGVTRARHNLWIVDASVSGQTMRDIWVGKDQVKVHKPGDELPSLAQSSTPDDWKKTAHMLFERKRYRHAMSCFERAGLLHQRDIAGAYHLRENARTTGDEATAGKAFEEVARDSPTEEDKCRYFRLSADCFAHAKHYTRAARLYYTATEYDRSVECYLEARAFNDVVRILTGHAKSMSRRVTQDAKEKARVYYLQNEQTRLAVALFDKDEEALRYMEEKGFHSAQAEHLESLERFVEAAEIHLRSDEPSRLDMARQLLKKTKTSVDPPTARRVCRSTLDRLWSSVTYTSGGPLRRTLSTKGLIGVAEELAYDADSDGLSAEVVMFRGLDSDDLPQPFSLAERLLSDNIPAALLCYDQAFSKTTSITELPMEPLSNHLLHFLKYVRILRDILTDRDCCSNAIAQKLFGYKRLPGGGFLLPAGSTLCTIARASEFEIRDSATTKGVEVYRPTLERLIKHVVGKRMKAMIGSENEQCREAEFLKTGRTTTSSGKKLLPQEAYDGQVRVCLQQILVLHCMKALPKELQDGKTQDQQRRFWLTELFRTLSRPHPSLGVSYALDASRVPELGEGLAAVGGLLSEISYSAYGISKEFVNTFLLVCTLSRLIPDGSVWKDIRGIFESIPRSDRPKSLLRGENQEFVVLDALDFFSGDGLDSLDLGISFVNHIIGSRFLVDIRILCDMMDQLCAMSIIASRKQAIHMHDVTLPLEWLVQVAPSLDHILKRNTTKIPQLQQALQDLVSRLSTGSNSSHIQYRDKPFVDAPPSLRNVVLCRLYRNLCLLRYNLKLPELSNMGYPPVHQFYSLYDSADIHAPRPLLWIFSELGAWKGNEQLVHLHHQSGDFDASCMIPGMRCLVFQDTKDISKSLQETCYPGRTSSPSLISALHPTRYPSITPNPSIDSSRSRPHLSPSTSSHPYLWYGWEHIYAAFTIQRAIRRFLARQSEAARDSLYRTKTRIYNEYLQASKEMPMIGEYTKQRVIILGALPHVILCLEEARNYASKKKTEAEQKRREGDVNPAVLTSRLKEATHLVDTAEKLLEELGPNVETIRWEELSDTLGRVMDLMDGLPPRFMKPLKADLDIGCEVIFMVITAEDDSDLEGDEGAGEYNEWDGSAWDGSTW